MDQPVIDLRNVVKMYRTGSIEDIPWRGKPGAGLPATIGLVTIEGCPIDTNIGSTGCWCG